MDIHKLIKGDIGEKINNKYALNDFFKVPAPDIIHKDAIWECENGEKIDCNIFHPKYGYLGFVTDNKQNVNANYSYTTYEDPDGRTVYSHLYANILCLHEDGSFTNKDGKKVIKKDWARTNQTKTASTEEDFKTIINKWAVLKGIPSDSPLLIEAITSHVDNLINLHKGNTTITDIDLILIGTAENFKKYCADNMGRLTNYNDTIINKDTFTNVNPEIIDGSNESEDKSPDINKENNFTLSTIEDFLDNYRSNMTPEEYTWLTEALKGFAQNSTIPQESRQIRITGRFNKKAFGWAVNRALDILGLQINYELLAFLKQNISRYANDSLNNSKLTSSNMYKYFHTKTV